MKLRGAINLLLEIEKRNARDTRLYKNMNTKRTNISETRHLLIEALEFWWNTWNAKPDHLGWSADKPNVLWLCSRWNRTQVVLDRDITRDEVASAQTTLRSEGSLYSNAGEIELAF